MASVYIFDFGNRIKVGRTNNVSNRLRQVEGAAGQRALRHFSVEIDESCEKRIHKQLSEHRLVGEYFDFPYDKAVELLKELSLLGGEKGFGTSSKVKALLNLRGKKIMDLADYFEMSPQAMRNKLNRGSFSAEDLIKISMFLGAELSFKISDNQHIVLDGNDLR